MPILFKDLKEIIPFDTDHLIKPNTFNIFKKSDIDVEDWFVHKQMLEPDVLEDNFRNWLIQKGTVPKRVVVWHWLCSSPDIAHIDCNSEGEIPSAALNWTINNNDSRVEFFHVPGVEKKVMHGNQADTNWKTDNVSAYIPVNVKGLSPAAVWNTRGPALLNISEPHLIVAAEMRTAISIQFELEEPFEIILGKLTNV
jgi:hypothetical protein